MAKVELFDDPWWRDWLCWLVIVFATGGLVVALAVRDASWVRALLQWGTSFGVTALVLGSVRQLVRGYREPPVGDR